MNPVSQYSAKLLVIGYVWPEPHSSAAGSHMMQLIESFQAQSMKIIFASPARKGEHVVDLSALQIEEKVIALNCSSFDYWVKEINPDIVVFDRFMMEEQFGWRVAEQCPNALRILETSDLHALRDARHQLLKNQSNKLAEHSNTELYAAMAMQDITQREIAAIYRSDLSLCVSSFEIKLLVEEFKIPEKLLVYCPFMLNINSEQAPNFQQRKNFVTIGNFLHAPNWDSVLWLKNEIWPCIRQQLPQSELFIYGAYASQKVLNLHNPKQGFHVFGWAEDAIQVLQQARVFLAPLRFGAGIKGKLADAMIAQTPNVTTTIGSESMSLEGIWNGCVVNDAEEFANAAVRLYENEEYWLNAQKHSSYLLEHRFNKSKVSAHLINAIQNCKNNLQAHRLDNFIGMMLQHHAHKSTKYMARWIEAKNILATR